MPDLESFDAFYARTVGNITSQMHSLAGEDSAADHAIREAYARAYQQWYQIAGNPDPEGWVLTVAQDAYQRRRPAAAVPPRDPARPGHDPLSMPGMFRPAVRPEPAGTGDTTLAPPAASPGGQAGSWFTPAAGSGMAEAADAVGTGPAQGISGVFGGRPAGPASAMATTQLGGDQRGVTGQPADPGAPWWPAAPARSSPRSRQPVRRPSVTLIALIVVIALAVAGGIAYLLAGQHAGGQAAGRGGTAGHRKPAVQMLAAGRTGPLGSIPWSLVGPGWTLAEVSTAAPGPTGNGVASGGGSVTTYLVDPEGGKYQIATSAGPAPLLLAWSGNGQHALFAEQPGSPGANVTYDLLSLMNGRMSTLSLPAGVTAVGFTRPDGFNILAVSQTATAFQLERFNLQGAYQATLGSLPVQPGATPNWKFCGTSCGALSSPDGLTAVWGVQGQQMQYLSNVGGPVIRPLTVPGSGPPSCVPLTWWNEGTVLASCVDAGSQGASRLWLVPADGSAPTALTGPSGSESGKGDLQGAWHLAGAVYVTAMNFHQCPGAPSGPGGMSVNTVSGGSLRSIRVAGTTNNHTSVVSAFHGQLLLLAQTSCPGTSSLLWLNPSTNTSQTVLSVPTGQVGVVAAVPYGSGPTAFSGG